MQFLEHAATGNWDLAAAVASGEMPSRAWNKEELRRFVNSLAPGDPRDAQHIAKEMYERAQAGELTADRCLEAFEEWHWLALRANDNWVEAVAEAKVALQWPWCTGEWLDYFLGCLQPNVNARQAAKDIYWWVLAGHLTRDQAAETLSLLLAPTASKIPPPQTATMGEVETRETAVLGPMNFLRVAATGNWDLAAVVASGEMPSRAWNKEELRRFVNSLAPGDPRDAQHIAKEMYERAQAGELTADRCLEAFEEWHWLALRANDNWVEAVAEAKVALQWPWCTGEWLDYFLGCLQPNVNARQAAKDIYWWVLAGHLTRDQATETLSRLLAPTASKIPQPQTATMGGVETDRAILVEAHQVAMVVKVPADQLVNNSTEAPGSIGADISEQRRSRKDSAKKQADSALAELQSQGVTIRLNNKNRYQSYKDTPTVPIRFAVYGGDTRNPVLVFDNTTVPDGAAKTYEGSLSVLEKAGGVGAKAGRFFKARGTDKLSSGTIAGVMTVTQIGQKAVDFGQLEHLLKKSGITKKKLVKQDF
ncbi:hypothetical protein AB0D66_31285 [Streptomyces sp. NPDC048270]|uniref:hypothetical protein n=1 Tax=Streptomyces sp. NPDC048270 TaxID=3154615 RepID=UPI0033C73D66